jgi:hypothetical protein
MRSLAWNNIGHHRHVDIEDDGVELSFLVRWRASIGKVVDETMPLSGDHFVDDSDGLRRPMRMWKLFVRGSIRLTAGRWAHERSPGAEPAARPGRFGDLVYLNLPPGGLVKKAGRLYSPLFPQDPQTFPPIVTSFPSTIALTGSTAISRR